MLAIGSCGERIDTKPAAPPPEVITTKLGVELVRIPAGSFEMGSAQGNADEAPVHTVTLDSFLMDRNEVTQAQFAALKLPDGSHFKNAENPVEMISIDKAAR